jgi:transcriptional regulator with XRE-family HTH domain
MSLISEKFADELAHKDAREAYLAAQTRTKIAEQIRVMRSQRGWSQGEFAKQLHKPQSNVSQRLENRSYGGFTLGTLLEVANALDVGLVIEFVPYEDFLRRTNDLSKKTLEVKSFSRSSLDPLCHNPADNSLSFTRMAPMNEVAIPPVPAPTNQATSGITASGSINAVIRGNSVINVGSQNDPQSLFGMTSGATFQRLPEQTWQRWRAALGEYTAQRMDSIQLTGSNPQMDNRIGV